MFFCESASGRPNIRQNSVPRRRRIGPAAAAAGPSHEAVRPRKPAVNQGSGMGRI